MRGAVETHEHDKWGQTLRERTALFGLKAAATSFATYCDDSVSPYSLHWREIRCNARKGLI